MLGFEVRPVTESSSMYPFKVPSESIGRVMLSTQRLWPSSCSFCVAFMPAPSSWMPEKFLYPASRAALAGGLDRVRSYSSRFDPRYRAVTVVDDPDGGGADGDRAGFGADRDRAAVGFAGGEAEAADRALARGGDPDRAGAGVDAAGVLADRDRGATDGLQRGVDA